MNKILTTAIIGALVGLGLGAGITYTLVPIGTTDTASVAGEKEPLYWVAPMDPNYRRDKPGKSPMGMDLIPVYEEDGQGDAGPGTVRISPDVVNNLGVRTGLAEEGALAPEINTVGYLEYNQDELLHINPRIEGWIDKLHVKTTGDRVQQGQPLYELYSPELVNAQQEFLMALRQNNQQLLRAAEDRLNAWRIPAGFVEQLRQSRDVQQNVAFHAPKSGYLEALNVREGEFVQPGKVLMSIGSLDEIWTEAEVYADQVHLVEERLPVAMTLDYLPGKTWQGEVDYVYPTLNPKTRTLPVRIKFDNEDGQLKPGMFANLLIRAESDAGLTLVPKEAVIRTGDMNRVVLALGDGAFKSVAVQLGRSDDQYFEIVEGVKPGERVVTSAQFLIDSESSKTSDFVRMDHGAEAGLAAMDAGEASAANNMDMNMDRQSEMDMDAGEDKTGSVQVAATVNSVSPNARKVNLTHAPIPAWDWPAMTMDFTVAKNVDLAALTSGKEVMVSIEKQGGVYVITAVNEVSRDGHDMSDMQRPMNHQDAQNMMGDHANHGTHAEVMNQSGQVEHSAQMKHSGGINYSEMSAQSHHMDRIHAPQKNVMHQEKSDSDAEVE